MRALRAGESVRVEIGGAVFRGRVVGYGIPRVLAEQPARVLVEMVGGALRMVSEPRLLASMPAARCKVCGHADAQHTECYACLCGGCFCAD